MPQLSLSRTFAVPQARVFAALADQDRMGAWMGAEISVPVRTPDLVGTVRRIHAGPMRFDERIVAVDPGRFIAYEICTPLPGLVRHHGTLHVDARGPEQSHVRWDIEMEFSVPLMGHAVLAGLRLLCTRGLAKLEQQLLRSGAA